MVTENLKKVSNFCSSDFPIFPLLLTPFCPGSESGVRISQPLRFVSFATCRITKIKKSSRKRCFLPSRGSTTAPANYLSHQKPNLVWICTNKSQFYMSILAIQHQIAGISKGKSQSSCSFGQHKYFDLLDLSLFARWWKSSAIHLPLTGLSLINF